MGAWRLAAVLSIAAAHSGGPASCAIGGPRMPQCDEVMLRWAIQPFDIVNWELLGDELFEYNLEPPWAVLRRFGVSFAVRSYKLPFVREAFINFGTKL